MFKNNLKILLIFLTACAFAEEKPIFIGFADKNKDGINDLFTDVNGDGVNDINGKSYKHRFAFQDENGDGINDLWVDVDGDGVNDLAREIELKIGGKVERPWVDKDGDGLLDEDAPILILKKAENHVIDEDNDGKNDITGIEYKGKGIMMGYRFGKIDEERGAQPKQFFDENGDGMDDRFEIRWQGKSGQFRQGNKDFFIDEDGDGICDGRTISPTKSRGSNRGRGKK